MLRDSGWDLSACAGGGPRMGHGALGVWRDTDVGVEHVIQADAGFLVFGVEWRFGGDGDGDWGMEKIGGVHW